MAVRKTISAHEQLRRQCGFTVTQLAEETGFAHSYVSSVESGSRDPSLRYRRAVAKVLKVPAEIIFPETSR